MKCPACGELSWRDHQPSEPFGPVHAVSYVTTVLLMFGWIPLFLWAPSWWTASIPVFALVGGIVFEIVAVNRRPLMLGPPQRRIG